MSDEKRWDTDPTTTPPEPWDEWSSYAGCWTCRSCGAAAGWGMHNKGCRHEKRTADLAEQTPPPASATLER